MGNCITVDIKKDENNIETNIKKEELTNISIKKNTVLLDSSSPPMNVPNIKLDLNNLSKVNCDIKKFTLDGTQMWGKVVHIYDGDTVHIVFIINNCYSKFVCRMAHIDTPEMASKNIKEKEAAIKSRNYLFEQVTDMKITTSVTKKDLDVLCEKSQKLIWVKCFEFDKYGRLLVNAWNMVNEKSINEMMVDEKHGKPYFGGKKKEWD
jgi:endonuclease YncB( thermonuclease family)